MMRTSLRLMHENKNWTNPGMNRSKFQFFGQNSSKYNILNYVSSLKFPVLELSTIFKICIEFHKHHARLAKCCCILHVSLLLDFMPSDFLFIDYMNVTDHCIYL